MFRIQLNSESQSNFFILQQRTHKRWKWFVMTYFIFQIFINNNVLTDLTRGWLTKFTLNLLYMERLISNDYPFNEWYIPLKICLIKNYTWDNHQRYFQNRLCSILISIYSDWGISASLEHGICQFPLKNDEIIIIKIYSHTKI